MHGCDVSRTKRAEFELISMVYCASNDKKIADRKRWSDNVCRLFVRLDGALTARINSVQEFLVHQI